MKTTRRQWIASTTSAAALSAPSIAAPAARKQPNILFVLSDDHSTPYLGCYNNGETKSPTFDKLARDGMLFHRMFTVAPQCVPSRAGFLTGRSAVAARMTRFSSALPAAEITIPEVLRQAGYYTGICGRTFHLDGSARQGPVTKALYEKLKIKTFANRCDYLDPGSPQEQTPRHLQTFLDKRPASKPFFLWMNFSDPHHVWTTNVPNRRHDPASLTVPAHLPDLPGVRNDLARYNDEIAHCDTIMEEVLDVLHKNNADDTLIVFCGDNGMAFPHGKGSLYDPGLNVPMIVRWSGVLKPNQHSRELFSGEDVAPTLIQAAGARIPPSMSGHSFLPLLQGRPFTPRTEIYAERGPHGGGTYTLETKASTHDQSRCVRTKDWKFIYNCTPYQQYQPVDSAQDPGWQEILKAHHARTLSPQHEKAYFTHPRPVYELFDLRNDPSELTNLAYDPANKEILHQLKLSLTEKMIKDHDYLPLPLSTTE